MGRCSGGTPRESSVWLSSFSAPSMPGRCWQHSMMLGHAFCFSALTPSIALPVSVHPVTPKWTSWCRRRREGQLKRVWWERTACAGLWTTRRTESLTVTPSSTSTSVWLLCTSWWPSPTGTSKYISWWLIVQLIIYGKLVSQKRFYQGVVQF